MLEIKELETGYGKKQVLFGMHLEVCTSEIVALIGPNGAGKSTVLKAVCGLLPLWKGEIRFNGDVIKGSNPARNVAKGITFAPQGSLVFADLTVKENLEIGGFQLSRNELKTRIVQIFKMFPVLKERARYDAGKLSGGEQQMLALARALIPKPKLLMLDEPSLGLSPNLVKVVFEKIVEINREVGVSILIVEQKVHEVLDISKKVYSLKLGQIAYEGASESLKDDKTKLKHLFL
ncbi:ABC transporter ATP-binding protein [Chlorobium sp. BLA1]|uniref:ABC transporter ATP-binding protein n=1 Tax=Candidatus Chlorobium masyuteum TaxID=2716876 RepID=UPI001420415C|nr:ABC transporter ATP-binding protein [Candidatus Chlorobium masyuteum]NHQ59671.1 ABC transporter ATP-binding protein [Candidatus Chlorobium masyuteum]